MLLGGFQRFSMIDYPEKICSIGFTQGCNFRCPYCHNPELVEPEQFTDSLSEEKIFNFLEERRGKIEGVAITGGEPTIHSDLLDFLKKIKAMDFLVKLDTNGANPEILEKIIAERAADYIAMDIKAPEHRYAEIAAAPVDIKKIKKSIGLIMNSGLPYEFRTTVVAGLLTKEDIIAIARLIFGARLFVMQKFLPTKAIDPNYLMEDTYSDEEFEEIKDSLRGIVERCIIR